MDLTYERRDISTRSGRHTNKGARSLRALLLQHPIWSVAALLLIAFNMRPTITSIAPFLGDIQRDLGLSALGISLLATAPVVCLGVFAPAAPALARRFGAEAVLLGSLLGIVLGAVARSFGVIPLFLGTVIIGASMSLLGVLTPVVIKRDLALSFILLRSDDQHVAAQLSSMAQTIGYAAGGLIGPLAVGLIHDWAGSWIAVEAFYAAAGFAALLLALGAGRARTIKTEAKLELEIQTQPRRTSA